MYIYVYIHNAQNLICAPDQAFQMLIGKSIETPIALSMLLQKIIGAAGPRRVRIQAFKPFFGSQPHGRSRELASQASRNDIRAFARGTTDRPLGDLVLCQRQRRRRAAPWPTSTKHGRRLRTIPVEKDNHTQSQLQSACNRKHTVFASTSARLPY